MLSRARTRPDLPRRRRSFRPRLEPMEGRLTLSATQLVVMSPPNSVTAGQPFNLSVLAEDASGNVDPAFTGNAVVGLASSPSGAVLGGSVGLTTATLSTGVASFTGLTLDQAGEYTLLVSGGGLAPVYTPAFDVTPATATQLAETSPPPATVPAGQAFGLTVAVEDQYGNTVTNFLGNLAVTPSNPATEGSLGGTLTVPVKGGVASFAGLSLPNAGAPFTLQVSSPGLPTVTTSPFSVVTGVMLTTSGGSNSGTVPYLVISQQPALVDVGRYFDLTVDVDTAQGTLDTSYIGTMSLALAGGPGGVALGGNLNMPVQHGLLTFYGLTLSAAGSGFTIRASIPRFAPAVTAPITAVNPPAMLAIVGPPPASLGPGRTFGLTVVVQDASGNRVPGYDGSVTLALIGHRGGAALRGARTVAAVDGVANFSGLSLKSARKGTLLEIQAVAGGLAGATMSLSPAMPAAPLHRSHPGRVRLRPGHR